MIFLWHGGSGGERGGATGWQDECSLPSQMTISSVAARTPGKGAGPVQVQAACSRDCSEMYEWMTSRRGSLFRRWRGTSGSRLGFLRRHQLHYHGTVWQTDRDIFEKFWQSTIAILPVFLLNCEYRMSRLFFDAVSFTYFSNIPHHFHLKLTGHMTLYVK